MQSEFDIEKTGNEAKMEEFKNSRYEYITREFETDIDNYHPSFEKSLEDEGWRRAWADITMEGTFVVYRREIPIHD